MDTRSSIINPLAQKRDFPGQFKKTCGSLIHDIVDNNETLEEQLLDLKKKKEESNEVMLDTQMNFYLEKLSKIALAIFAKHVILTW